MLNAKILKHPLLGKNLTLGHVLWTRKEIAGAPYSIQEIGRIFRETIFPQIENYCGSNKDVLGSLLGPELRDKVIYVPTTKEECKQNVLIHPTEHSKERETFIAEYMKNGFTAVVKKYTQEGWKLRWKIRIAKLIR